MWGDNLFRDPNLCAERLQNCTPALPFDFTAHHSHCDILHVRVAGWGVRVGVGGMIKGMSYPSYPEEMF